MTDPEQQKNPWEFMEQASNDEEPQTEAAATEEPSPDVDEAEDDAATDAQQDTTPSAEAGGEAAVSAEDRAPEVPTGENATTSSGEPANDGESGTAQEPVAEAPSTTGQDESADAKESTDAVSTMAAEVGSDAETETDEAGDGGDAESSGDEAADDADDVDEGDSDAEAAEDSTDEVVEITEDENWSSRYTAQYGEEEVRELASDLEHHICSTAGGLMLLALPLFPAFQMANSWAPKLRAYNTLMGYAIIVVFWFTCVWGFFRLTITFARMGPDYSRWFSRAMVVAVLINLIWMAKWMNDQANYGW